MFCPNCGKQLADDAMFCDNCGSPQQAQPAPVSVNPGVPVTPGITWEDATAPAKKKKTWIPIVAGVLVIALLITGCILLFGKKTVYLVSKSVTESSYGQINTSRREYDDDGRLISIRYITEYDEDYEYGTDSLRELSYEYDKDGNLESAKLEIARDGEDPDIIKVEYSYKKGVLDDIEVDHYNDDMEYDIDFTNDGKIKQITILRDDEEYMVYSYRYHDNGQLKTAEVEYLSWDQTNKSTYDELGRQIEYSYSYNGELIYKSETEYMDDTTIPSKTVTINYEDGEEYARSTTRIETVIKNKKITELSITVENVEDGEKAKVTLSGDVEWDGLEGTWEPKIKGDLEEMGYNDEALEMEFEMDKDGNVGRYEIIMDGETVQSTETEYIAIKVPRNYEHPNANDPIYVVWLSN